MLNTRERIASPAKRMPAVFGGTVPCCRRLYGNALFTAIKPIWEVLAIKRNGWLLAFLVAAALMITASVRLLHRDTAPASGGDAPGAPGGEIELAFMNSWGGVDGRAQLLSERLAAFMHENPGITVRNLSVYGDDFLPELKTRFALGEDPDVFGLWPGSDMRALIEAGRVADLTLALNQDLMYKNAFNDDMWRYVTQDGKIYGLPVEIIFEALFINRGLISSLGYQPPTTYEQLLELAKELRGSGVIPIAYNSEPEGSYLYQNLVLMHGGRFGVENPVENGRVQDCYIQAMYRMRELYEAGAFPADYHALSSVARDDLFLDHKAAMIVQGSWFISNVGNDALVDIIPFPVYDQAQSSPDMVYGMGCGIFCASSKAMQNPEKSEATAKLLRFLASEETAKAFAQRTGMLSNIRISQDVPYNRLTQKGISLISAARQLAGPPDSYIHRTVWETVIVERFFEMLQRKISPEDLWELALEAGV